jgi:hypothetical protein
MQAFWAAIFTLAALTATSAQQTEALSKTPVPRNGETVKAHTDEATPPSEGTPIRGAALVQKHDPEEAKAAAKQGALQFLPHPFAYVGAGLMGAGYARLAATSGAGFRIDSTHILANFEGSYDNGHKVNDNDQPNPKGHDRGLSGSAYYRFSSGWFFGAGERWSQLSTTNYTKAGSRPTFGGGKDYFHHLNCTGEGCVDFSMRIGVDYLLKGSDHVNGSQGPLLTVIAPSPSAKGHFFFRETIGIYSFHDTVTDPNNAILTREQVSNRHVDSFSEITLMYRF